MSPNPNSPNRKCIAPVLRPDRLSALRRALAAAWCVALLNLFLSSAEHAVRAQDDPDVVCSPAWIQAGRTPLTRANRGGRGLSVGPEAWVADGSFAPRSQIIDQPVLPVPGPDPDALELPSVAVPPALSQAPFDDVGAASESCQAVSPADTFYNQYQRTAMLEIGAPDAWSISYGGPDVTIALIGTGIHVANPDLVNKVWSNPREVANGVDDDGNGYVDDVNGWNFPARNGDINDDFGGDDTKYAGIAAAETSNNDGIAGLSWKSRIMVLKALYAEEHRDSQGQPYYTFGGQSEDITEAICYAANAGARVIHINAFLKNMELPSSSIERMRKAIEYAYAHGNGAVIVAPAGDCGDTPCGLGDVNPTILPAAFNRVIGAQAYDTGFAVRPNASHGFWVDIAAPGRGLGMTYYHPLDTSRRDFIKMPSSWRNLSGFASAQIAGVAAVILTANPLMRPAEVERAICKFADRSKNGPYEDLTNDPVDPQPRNDTFGCGVLSMEHTLERMPWTVTTQPPSVTVITDGRRGFISQTVTSLSLNDCAWTLAANVPWIDISPPKQAKGFPSKSQVSVNWENLIQNVGGRGPQAGDRFTATLTACPDNAEQGSWPGAWGDGCQRIPFVLQIVEQFFDVYLPFAALAHTLLDEGFP